MASTDFQARGSITALITPLRDGVVDRAAFERLVERQIAAGTSALVPVGTTGESTTLSHDEHRLVVALCVRIAAGRVAVIAGAGSNATAEAIELTRFAAEVGADAALSVAPYYNKPSQDGLYRHYRAIHDASDLPILLYNVPSRTIVDIAVETIARLAELPRIVGVKDATADLARPARLRRLVGPDFLQLSGDDATALAHRAVGGCGCISVTSNIAPAALAAMHAATDQGDHATAGAINDRLAPLHDALFCEPSPGPVKYAASLLGFGTAETRLPLAPISEAAERRVRAALNIAGLLG